MTQQEEVMGIVNAMRADWATNDAKRDAGIVDPEALVIIEDISYAKNDDIWNKMDIYMPEETVKPSKTIVNVHGGGWFYGDKHLYSYYCKSLASKGFVVVNFNYRLSPENKFPAAIEDVCKVMTFIKGNYGNYMIDVDNIAMFGDSCGAQLVSQYVTMAINPEYRKLFNCHTENLMPKVAALNCGVYNMIDLRKHKIVNWYLPDNISDNHEEAFDNMIKYMTSDFCPTYIMSSVNDNLMSCTATMVKAMEDNNIEYVYREYGQDNKDDGHVFHLNHNSKTAHICNREEVDFINKYIN